MLLLQFGNLFLDGVPTGALCAGVVVAEVDMTTSTIPVTCTMQQTHSEMVVNSNLAMHTIGEHHKSTGWQCGFGWDATLYKKLDRRSMAGLQGNTGKDDSMLSAKSDFRKEWFCTRGNAMCKRDV